MCGIAGFSHTGKPSPTGLLTFALHGLGHRGPDHSGQFTCEDLTMGAVRLRILDLEGGDQPMSSADGDVVLVFNGEVYNFRELRAELEAEGHKFRTRCDTEVVLQAYLRWGTDSFRRLRGMFALAIWVQSQRKLILARDPMGIKPLYYCLRAGDIYFGSELKTIFAHPQIPRHISLPGLNCFLHLNYVPGPLTLVEDILKLMPGHMLTWRWDRCEIESYMPHRPATPAPASLDDACAELDHLLASAVREQMVSDVPLGIWLSGGLDSSTVLHYASSVRPSGLQSFSITFRGQSFDESEYMKEVSRHFGTQHSEFDLNTDVELVDAIEQIAYYSDEPSADAGALPVWFLARMTRKQATVVLSGEGSDELFGGYLTYQADRYRALACLAPRFLWKGVQSLAALLPASNEKIGLDYKIRRFVQGIFMSPEQAHVFWNGTFGPEEKGSFFHFDDPRPMAALLGHMPPVAGLQRYLDFDQRYYLPDDILYKVDRMSMAHSVEARPPFLDPRVVDFAARLPQRFKLRGTRSKYVLRKLMEGKLPPAVLRRPKVGFDIPIHQWLRGALRPFLLDTLSQEAVSATGLFRWQGVQRLIADHLERRENLGYHLWGLIVLLTWMNRWEVTLPPELRARAEQNRVPEEAGSLSRLPASSTS